MQAFFLTQNKSMQLNAAPENLLGNVFSHHVGIELFLEHHWFAALISFKMR